MSWCIGAMVLMLLRRLPTSENPPMTRLTITVADQTHRALKEAAARQGRSMAAIIEESLEMRGIRPYESARELVLKARANSGLDSDRAMALAVEETRRRREGM